MRPLVIKLIILGTLSLPLSEIAVSQNSTPFITGPLTWGKGEFYNPTSAKVCVQNYRHGSSFLCLDLSRQQERTRFTLRVRNLALHGDAKHADATLAELQQVLDKAREWAEKARLNNISTLEPKTLFTFVHTQAPSSSGAKTYLMPPATFSIYTERNERIISFRLELETFHEPEWPALQFVVNHMKDMIPMYEDIAIPAERAQAADKQKKDSLFTP